jgi:hypothetical protein
MSLGKEMKIARKAPDALRILWKEKFFEKEKGRNEVEQALHNRGYNFGDATRKALDSADFLLKSGKKGERKFSQKHPFTEERENEKKNRK